MPIGAAIVRKGSRFYAIFGSGETMSNDRSILNSAQERTRVVADFRATLRSHPSVFACLISYLVWMALVFQSSAVFPSIDVLGKIVPGWLCP